MPQTASGSPTAVSRGCSPAGHLRQAEQPERQEQRAHHEQRLLGPVGGLVAGPPRDLLGEVHVADEDADEVLRQSVEQAGEHQAGAGRDLHEA